MCLPRTDLSCRQALKKDRWKNGLKQREGEGRQPRGQFIFAENLFSACIKYHLQMRLSSINPAAPAHMLTGPFRELQQISEPWFLSAGTGLSLPQYITFHHMPSIVLFRTVSTQLPGTDIRPTGNNRHKRSADYQVLCEAQGNGHKSCNKLCCPSAGHACKSQDNFQMSQYCKIQS